MSFSENRHVDKATPAVECKGTATVKPAVEEEAAVGANVAGEAKPDQAAPRKPKKGSQLVFKWKHSRIGPTLCNSWIPIAGIVIVRHHTTEVCVDLIVTQDGKDYWTQNRVTEDHFKWPTKDEHDDFSRHGHWEHLQRKIDEGFSQEIVMHVPLSEFLQNQAEESCLLSRPGQGTLRLMTWNVRHFGAKPAPSGRETATALKAAQETEEEKARRFSMCVLHLAQATHPHAGPG
jgi:hypothetical protein